MKTGIHPKYNTTIEIVCACGNITLAGSTVTEIKTELCSACHPFYTGKQKLVDTAGKVDKFMARIKKAQAFKEQQVKKVEPVEEEILQEKLIEETEEIKAPKPILAMPTGEDIDSEETPMTEEKAAEEEKPKKAAAKKPTAKKPAAKAPKTTAKKTSKK